MSERYPLLPELVLCMVGLYLGLIGVYHRAGLPTQSEMIAARIEERSRQRSEAMQDAPLQTARTPTPTQPEDSTPRLPAALTIEDDIPAKFLPQALRQPEAIPTLRLSLVGDVLHAGHEDASHPAEDMLARLREEGISVVRVSVPAELKQDERVASFITGAMRGGMDIHLDLEPDE